MPMMNEYEVGMGESHHRQHMAPLTMASCHRWRRRDPSLSFRFMVHGPQWRACTHLGARALLEQLGPQAVALLHHGHELRLDRPLRGRQPRPRLRRPLALQPLCTSGTHSILRKGKTRPGA